MASHLPARALRLALTAIGFSTLTYPVLLADAETMFAIAGKERVLELVGAVSFLVASLFYFLSYSSSRKKAAPSSRPRALVYLFLTCLFFVAMGEEISWGQHLVSFSTPKIVERVNVQKELNIHNLIYLDTFDGSKKKKTGLGALLNSNRLFDYFMIGFFLIAPAFAAMSPRLSPGSRRSRFPVSPMILGLPLLVNYLFSAVAELWVVQGRYYFHIATSEIREANYAVLCLASAIYFYWRERSTAADPEP